MNEKDRQEIANRAYSQFGYHPVAAKEIKEAIIRRIWKMQGNRHGNI